MADDTRKYDAVAKRDKLHDSMTAIWAKMRAIVEGEEAVHAGKTSYLPKLNGQDDAQYDAYRKRAPFVNATGRTLDGVTGVMFARPIKVSKPDSAQPIVDDITLDGEPLSSFAENVAREVVSQGGVAILADFPMVEGELPVTRAEEQARNLRPFAKVYRAEAVLGFMVGQVNNASKLIQVRLLEEAREQDPSDEFGEVCVDQVRVLELVRNTAGEWTYQQRLFRKNAKDEWEPYGNPIVPLRGGKPIGFIPFQFCDPRGTSPSVAKPPLLDVANINLHHYQLNADYHHGLHFTALPMAWFAGFGIEKGTPIAIGAENAMVTENAQASAGYLEFTGQGLAQIDKQLLRSEQQMAALGARMLMPEKAGVEAADAIELRSKGEQSVVSAIAVNLGLALTNVLRWLLWWDGTDDALTSDAIKVELNRDLLPRGVTAQTITALLSALQAGRITHKTFVEYLQRADLIDPTMDPDDYVAEAQAEKPPSLDLDPGAEIDPFTGLPKAKPGDDVDGDKGAQPGKTPPTGGGGQRPGG